MALLLNEASVHVAIGYALPSIREVLSDGENTWGPKGLVIAVGGKGLGAPVTYTMDELGHPNTWAQLWQGRDFYEIALNKMRVSLATGKPTGLVVADSPWMLDIGDFIYQGGVAEDTNLAVGCSGAYGETDEACAWVVWNFIRLVCLRNIAVMRERKINRIS